MTILLLSSMYCHILIFKIFSFLRRLWNRFGYTVLMLSPLCLIMIIIIIIIIHLSSAVSQWLNSALQIFKNLLNTKNSLKKLSTSV